MGKTNRARYTLEFKLEAVKLIGAGQSVAATAAILSLPDHTLHNWLKAHREGRLGRAGLLSGHRLRIVSSSASRSPCGFLGEVV